MTLVTESLLALALIVYIGQAGVNLMQIMIYLLVAVLIFIGRGI